MSATFDVTEGVDRITSVIWYPTVDCYVRFGPGTLGAAVATDFPMLAGWLYRFLHIGDNDRHCSVLRASADGFLCFYPASLLNPIGGDDSNDRFPETSAG